MYVCVFMDSRLIQIKINHIIWTIAESSYSIMQRFAIWRILSSKFALCKCHTITSHFKNGVLKLQLRVRHSNAGIAGRNVRLWHAIMVHRNRRYFRVSDNGDRVSAGFLRASNYIFLRGIRWSNTFIDESWSLTIFIHLVPGTEI